MFSRLGKLITVEPLNRVNTVTNGPKQYGRINGYYQISIVTAMLKKLFPMHNNDTLPQHQLL